jgi:hypothetical protein
MMTEARQELRYSRIGRTLVSDSCRSSCIVPSGCSDNRKIVAIAEELEARNLALDMKTEGTLRDERKVVVSGEIIMQKASVSRWQRTMPMQGKWQTKVSSVVTGMARASLLENA